MLLYDLLWYVSDKFYYLHYSLSLMLLRLFSHLLLLLTFYTSFFVRATFGL